jgi:hypothetical protein
MDANARPHRANIVNQHLEAETIEKMEWTVNDINNFFFFFFRSHEK